MSDENHSTRMPRILPIVAIFFLTGCATVKDYASCDNAQAAVRLAQRLADRVCPIAP
jgi:uncharacterized lipoprotein YajG